MTTNSILQANRAVIPIDTLLAHWQGHRRLTRKMIEAFPEDKLFTYSLGGMRPFSEMVMEFLGMAVPGMNGIATGEWKSVPELWHHQKNDIPKTKTQLLDRWDEATGIINELWSRTAFERFMETDKAFGEWEGPVYSFLLYWIDNEIHHRGQAYVYLRSLGIDPPAFWDRS